MSNELLNSGYCPIKNPTEQDFKKTRTVEKLHTSGSGGIIDSVKRTMSDFWHRSLRQETKEQTQSQLEDLKFLALPPIVRKHQIAKKEILKDCIETVNLKEAVALVEDPRGNAFSIRMQYTTAFSTKGPKEEIRQIRKVASGHTLVFESIGGKNGYNTEYMVTATKDGKSERWSLLSLRFGKMTNDYYHKDHVLKETETQLNKNIKILEEQENEQNAVIKRLLNDRYTLLHPPKSKYSKSKALKKGGKAVKTVKPAKQKSRDSSAPIVPEGLNQIEAKIAKNRGILQDIATELEDSRKELAKVKTERGKLRNLPESMENVSYVPFTNFRRSAQPGGVATKEQEKTAMEVEKSGLLSLKNSVNKAWSAPDTEEYITNLKDRNDEKLSLHDAFPKEIGIVLAIVERMGFIEYLKWYDGKSRTGELKDMETVNAMMDSQIERALNNLWLNQAGAFNYIRSEDSGARGIAQMMSRTHRDFVNKYGNEGNLLQPPKTARDANGKLVTTSAGFSHNFIHASTDESQSLKFMLTHLYDESSNLPAEIRNNWQELIINPKTRYGLLGILAAGYNGDIARVKDQAGVPSGIGSMKVAFRWKRDMFAMNEKKMHTRWAAVSYQDSRKKLEELFETKGLVARLDTNIETKTYVMKFEYVWKHLKRKFPTEFAAEMSE